MHGKNARVIVVSVLAVLLAVGFAGCLAGEPDEEVVPARAFVEIGGEKIRLELVVVNMETPWGPMKLLRADEELNGYTCGPEYIDGRGRVVLEPLSCEQYMASTKLLTAMPAERLSRLGIGYPLLMQGDGLHVETLEGEITIPVTQSSYNSQLDTYTRTFQVGNDLASNRHAIAGSVRFYNDWLALPSHYSASEITGSWAELGLSTGPEHYDLPEGKATLGALAEFGSLPAEYSRQIGVVASTNPALLEGDCLVSSMMYSFETTIGAPFIFAQSFTVNQTGDASSWNSRYHQSRGDDATNFVRLPDEVAEQTEYATHNRESTYISQFGCPGTRYSVVSPETLAMDAIEAEMPLATGGTFRYQVSGDNSLFFAGQEILARPVLVLFGPACSFNRCDDQARIFDLVSGTEFPQPN